MTASKLPPERVAAHTLLARHLTGEGLELGPGDAPFTLPFTGTSVRYVDRWDPATNKALFPELTDDDGFPQPDIVANLDVDRLSAVKDTSQDFIICSHVLEHLAEPLGQIAEIHRVLKPGGLALILLPDRRLTFDKDRKATSLEHLHVEWQSRTTVVDDDHVDDFLRGTEGIDESMSEQDRQLLFDLHRQRSIHVHCWTQDEFLPVLLHSVRVLDVRWELVDTLFVEDVPNSFEFGYILRRPLQSLPTETTAERLQQVWDLLRKHSLDSSARAAAAVTAAQVADLESRLATTRQQLDAVAEDARIGARVRTSPAFQVALKTLAVQRRLRGRVGNPRP